MKISCESCGTRYSIPDEKIRGKGRTFKIRCKSCGATMIVKGIEPGEASAEDADQDEGASWYYAIGTDRKGPVAEDELVGLLQAGTIVAETYVWRQGMANWTHLGGIEELQSLIPAPAPSEAAPAAAEAAGAAGAADDEDEECRDTAYMSQAELMAAQQAYAADYKAEDEAEPATEPETPDVAAEAADDGLDALIADAASAPAEPASAEPVAAEPVAAEPAAVAAATVDEPFGDGGMDDDPFAADAAPTAVDPIAASAAQAAATATDDPFFADLAAPDDADSAPDSADPFMADLGGDADDPFAAAASDDAVFAAEEELARTMEGDAPVFEAPSEPAITEPRDDPFALQDHAPVAAAPGPTETPTVQESLFGDDTSESDSDDIFNFDSVEDEDEEPTGIHQRRESSVLFSLDELANPAKGLGAEDLLTESSGLIDIRAAAQTSTPATKDNPFADVGAAGLVAPARPGFTAISVPIVRQKKSKLPIIVAVAAVVVIGVGLAVFFATRGPDPQPQPGPATAGVVKDDTAKANPTADKPAADKPAADKPAADKPAADKPAADKPATADQPPGDGTQVAKVDGTQPAAGAGTPTGDQPPGDAKPAEGDQAKPAGDGAAAEVGTTPPADKPKPKPKPGDRRKPKPKPKPKPKDPTPKADKTPDPKPTPKPKPPKENTDDVNALLQHLGKSGPKPGADSGVDSTLPKRLSAPVVKRVLRARHSEFRGCYRLQANPPPGAVTVRTSFVIKNSGRVSSARVTSSGGTSGDVQACIVRILKGLKFDKFRDPSQPVNYPIRLQ